MELEDINGDSLDDIVIVVAETLSYALNRGGDRFDDLVTISEIGGQALPLRADGTTVLYAAMNGSGSDDVVWISGDGDVTYFELFPLRPNLLTRITNGIDLMIDVTYSTTVEQIAADAGGWAYKLPFAMIVAETIDTYDAVNDVHNLTSFTYHDAYYDAEEKALRGYALVEILREGDDTQEGALTENHYDLGVDNPYAKGRMLRERVFALGAGALRAMTETHNAFANCPLDDLPEEGELAWPVRFICNAATETTRQEGVAKADWVTTRTEFSYDGYGNVVELAELGVVRIGGGGCGACDRDADQYGEACGEACEGDERYTQTTYVPPLSDGGRWITQRIATEYIAAERGAAGATSQRFYYYDGDDFEGLALGHLTDGLVSRIEARVDGNSFETMGRHRYDADGNWAIAMWQRGKPRIWLPSSTPISPRPASKTQVRSCPIPMA